MRVVRTTLDADMRLFKQLFALGIVVYAVLCVLALVFYKERMVLPDDANYLFELVTNGGHFAFSTIALLPFLRNGFLIWPLGVVSHYRLLHGCIHLISSFSMQAAFLYAGIDCTITKLLLR